ncbi:helix-turn-helix transcriptional regulator [Streptomyces megasporus]|uniref:helix-turn-helix transcriptional regulator n=1 Tax=Streptomyces megasporus TaxID=44060 RepID=UPI0004E23DC1|nr:helix-turn-helix transcriptional regulator [Streptomyces megasporus]
MNVVPDASARPDDGDAFRSALRLTRRRIDLPVVFAGQVRDGVLRLSQFIGTRTAGMHGLDVFSGTGIGGRALATRRPAAVADYRSADSITHDYDAVVTAEGIRAITAVPVVVSGSVRGVLYGASRGSTPLGDRATDTMVDASRRLAGEIAVRDEVDRRLRLLNVAEADRGFAGDRVATEEIREVHAELRAIAGSVEDDALRDRILTASRRLAGLGAGQTRPAVPSPLSPREIDVLAQVALGCGNAEAAGRLSLRPESVKAHLRNAMRKLGVHNRFEAVVAARRRGLLP